MKILIDADGCPVVDITIKLANKYKIDCYIICDTSHIFEKDGATIITVSKGTDNVDFALVNRLKKGDIVITQDYGLAAMCLARQALPINQNGMIYTKENIDSLLFTRFANKKVRMSGGRIKGNSKRTKEQDVLFENCLEKTIKNNTPH